MIHSQNSATGTSYKNELSLNSVLSQCVRGKSSIARKPEVHPKIFSSKKL